MKELSVQAGMPGEIEDKMITMHDTLAVVLQDEEDWSGAAELLSRSHLPPSECTISAQGHEAFKAKMLVRIAELHLEHDVAHTEVLVRHAELALDTIEKQGSNNLSLAYATTKLRAQI